MEVNQVLDRQKPQYMNFENEFISWIRDKNQKGFVFMISAYKLKHAICSRIIYKRLKKKLDYVTFPRYIY